VKAWIAVLLVTVGASLLKALGPLTLGRRPLPDSARRVVGLMAPALLAGLIVVELGGDGLDGLDWAQIAGVVVAGIAWRLRAPMLLAVLLGALSAAALRLL
jgi:branched-subunit amino acid transport protein